jgi:hypothetical protein
VRTAGDVEYRAKGSMNCDGVFPRAVTGFPNDDERAGAGVCGAGAWLTVGLALAATGWKGSRPATACDEVNIPGGTTGNHDPTLHAVNRTSPVPV